jgi:predicted ATPase/class 3 adenylate cyclase
MSDIRALLLTDVVDSTKLSERLGDSAMAEVWAQHDRVARDLLPSHGGREIDKTDGMLLMFDTSPQAVAYAMAYHHALSLLPEPLKARAGLHVGPVVLRENSADDVARGAKPLEVDGLAKPTAARVMSLAVGAQTLLTAEAFTDLGESALQTQSHGHWMVKGVSEPIEIFEVAPEGQAMVQPPDSEKVFRVVREGDWWLPVKEIPNNLPHPGTSFIGREKEQADVMAQLGRVRLVTLLGMGGLGKTRLSLEMAVRLMHTYPDGVWFLDLSPITDPALVVSEAAQMMGVREEPGRPLLQSVVAHLKTRRTLLVFDNCEHLIKPAADLAHALIKGTQNVRIVASSREALHVPGEYAYPVLPLPLPGARDSLAVLQQSTAVLLFVARAQSHKPSFELDEDNAAQVAKLVSRLEGIPLALELAAARVRAMSITDINKRLNDRYKLLTGGARVHQERQQTLRALVDWSYDLLQDTEKTLLNRLAVFKGGMDLEAVEAICGTDPLDPLDVLDLVTSLVEKSLVTVVETDDTTRYKMLETIREYAREKLEASGELDAIATGHCNHFFAFAKDLKLGMQGSKQGEWVSRMEVEHDNVRAAMSLALAGGVDPIISVKLAVRMQGFWILRGYASEGRNLIRAALALAEVLDFAPANAYALYVGAALAQSQGDFAEALQMLQQCLLLQRRVGDSFDVAANLSTLSLVLLKLEDSVAASAAEKEALELFRGSTSKVEEARVGATISLLHLGQISASEGNDDEAREYLELSLQGARTLKHLEVESDCEIMLGEIEYYAAEWVKAKARFQRALAVSSTSNDLRGLATSMWWLARLDLSTNAVNLAKKRLGEALDVFVSFDMREQLLSCLEDCSALAQAIEMHMLAINLAAAADNLRKRFVIGRPKRFETYWQALLASLHHSLAEDAFNSAWVDGVSWEMEKAIQSAHTVLHST